MGVGFISKCALIVRYMKIGFDISQTGKDKAGCGYFADSLIQWLTDLDSENEYILYPRFGTTFWDPDAERSTRKIDHPNVSRKFLLGDFSKSMSFWKNLPSDAEELLGTPDIIHANNFSCPVCLKQARLVYTLYDLNFLEYPELTTEQNWWSCFEGVFSASIGADFIISISGHSRARFLETFPHYPKERVRVVYLGSRFRDDGKMQPQRRKIKALEPGKFWLGVGTIEPRKNLRRLLKAFSLYKKRSVPQYPLVLGGGKGWLEDGIEEFIQELGLVENVYILGYVSDEELAWLYANCFCFVYPSLYEGFGLPVLEAMSLGAAVITSNKTSLPEVAGDAGHYINPYDELDIAFALHKIADNVDYREELKRKAVIQAKKFSWEKTAREVLSIYNQVIDMPKFGGYPG
jgi:glycosyltransferase involved in cell wall biosynthesis